MDCIFCKIVAGEILASKVYEDENFLAFLDITPVNPGHVLVIPKSHQENLLDLPEDEARNIIAVIKKIAPAVLQAANSSGFNLTLNNGSIAGQVVGHAHFHLIPRFAGDGYELWHGRQYGEGEAAALAEKIKNNLP